ncbi:hypothetical protein V7024_20180 [Bacillus sp. JJ864]|uniref:hypothetical protein n=1 Tax=Bacillus sp. JJ864 TaxID=3122975 RepID=UPI002FFE23C1
MDFQIIIVGKLGGASVKKIEVNEHLGTDTPDDYIVLAYLSFDRANSKGTTKKMIEQYNNEIGALVGNMEQNAQILTIFWKVPYQQKDTNLAKTNLERADTKMKFKSNWFARALN